MPRITVQGNLLAAFARVGVLDEVLAHGVPFNQFRMLHADGTLIADGPTPHTGGAALAELVTDDLPVERALSTFMACRMPRVEIRIPTRTWPA